MPQVDDLSGSPIDRLSPKDVAVVGECLAATVSGPFFPDWEFGTLMGLERDQVAQVLERWPDPASPKDEYVAVSNALNNLLGYPHGGENAWGRFISVPREEVAAILSRWRGDAVPSARGYFDRLL